MIYYHRASKSVQIFVGYCGCFLIVCCCLHWCVPWSTPMMVDCVFSNWVEQWILEEHRFELCGDNVTCDLIFKLKKGRSEVPNLIIIIDDNRFRTAVWCSAGTLFRNDCEVDKKSKQIPNYTVLLLLSLTLSYQLKPSSVAAKSTWSESAIVFRIITDGLCGSELQSHFVGQVESSCVWWEGR